MEGGVWEFCVSFEKVDIETQVPEPYKTLKTQALGGGGGGV